MKTKDVTDSPTQVSGCRCIPLVTRRRGLVRSTARFSAFFLQVYTTHAAGCFSGCSESQELPPKARVINVECVAANA